MEEVPLAAGLQIIDAQCLSDGIPRHRYQSAPDFDSRAFIEDAFQKLRRNANSKHQIQR